MEQHEPRRLPDPAVPPHEAGPPKTQKLQAVLDTQLRAPLYPGGYTGPKQADPDTGRLKRVVKVAVDCEYIMGTLRREVLPEAVANVRAARGKVERAHYGGALKKAGAALALAEQELEETLSDYARFWWYHAHGLQAYPAHALPEGWSLEVTDDPEAKGAPADAEALAALAGSDSPEAAARAEVLGAVRQLLTGGERPLSEDARRVLEDTQAPEDDEE